MNRNIGDKIKYMRQRKNLSQYALAKKAGVAQSTLSYIEKGAKQPRFDTLRALCAALDITMLEFLTCNEDVSTTRFFREEHPEPAYFINAGDFERYLYQMVISEDELPAVHALSVCESESLI